MTIVAAFMAIACGGNKQINPYTKILDQAYKAVEKGDFELTEQLLSEYEVWLNGLPEGEARLLKMSLQSGMKPMVRSLRPCMKKLLRHTVNYICDL